MLKRSANGCPRTKNAVLIGHIAIATTGSAQAAAQIFSGTISIAPLGHSATHIPQPLQKSRSIS